VSHELLNKAAAGNLKAQIPAFEIGDTVRVDCRIVEGDKERIQAFTGTVTARRGSGVSEMFTVRRIVNNEGVERTFPLHSPKIAGVEVIRHGRTRRAKLYYLRGRRGKATRLREDKRKSGPSTSAPAAEEPAPPAEPSADEGGEA